MFLFRSRSKTPTRSNKASENSSPTGRGSPDPDPILNDGHIGRILAIEEKLRSENFPLKLVEELVQLYARAVEYCDSIRANPLRNYFKEKITVLAAQAVKRPDKPFLENTPTNHLRQGINFKPLTPFKDVTAGPVRAHELESYKEKKSRQWNFEANLNKQVEAGAKSIDKVLDKQKQLQNNDQLVKDSLKAQQTALQDKLRQRRDKSFNKSMNRGDDSSYIGERPGQGESFFKKQKEDNEDLMSREMLANNILKLLDDIGPGKGS